MFLFHSSIFFIFLVLLGFCSCSAGLAPASGHRLSGMDEGIFPVKPESSTQGYRMICSLSGKYPELDSFLKSRGLPGFVAQTAHHSSQYLIMYYVKERKAYVCKGETGFPQHADLIGPFPIKDGEIEILKTIGQRRR
jgi:hypothetical protein